MQGLTVVLEDDRWRAVGLATLAETVLTATLSHLHLDVDASEVSIMGCDDARIAALNAEFRGNPSPTNVLSWPSEERGPLQPGNVPPAPEPDFEGVIELGDIALSFDTCRAEADAAGKPISTHTTHLIVHGVLHLLGYDHETDVDAALMEGIEVKILGKMGHDDPYRDIKA